MFALNIPINPVSFGQVSTAILKEAIKDSQNLPSLFPIGNVSLDHELDKQKLAFFIRALTEKGMKEHDKKKNPAFKLWHINGGMESFSEKQVFYTFHETDTLTPYEINILKNQNKVLVSSSYTKEVFNAHGLNNVEYCPLGFNSDAFQKLNKKYYTDESIITFGLFGKFEHRKRTAKILSLWAKIFGNNPKYRLHCAIYNGFLVRDGQDYNHQMIANALGGKSYANIVFLPQVATNSEYNDIVNSCNIVLAFSGGEGLDMPVFHSVAMGKHCAGIREHAYKDYLNDENSVSTSSDLKVECYDNIFFSKGSPFNQGFFYDFSEESFEANCKAAIERYRINPINSAGLKLQESAYSQTWQKIKESLLS